MLQWVTVAFCWLLPLVDENNLVSVEDALWQGELEIRVAGPIFTQSLANRTLGDSSNTSKLEFLKEKGQMDLDFVLKIRFQINALGEFSLVETESMSGSQSLSLERRYQYIEEKFIEQTRITAQQRVKVSERKSMTANFQHDARFDETNFKAGVLRLVPSGRMNKKGEIQVVGDLKFRFAGEGETIIFEERQPPSETYGQRKVTEQITRFYDLPLTFNFKIDHRRKAVEGSFPVEVVISNPFASDEEDGGRKDIFRHQVNASGKYSLTPLF